MHASSVCDSQEANLQADKVSSQAAGAALVPGISITNFHLSAEKEQHCTQSDPYCCGIRIPHLLARTLIISALWQFTKTITTLLGSAVRPNHMGTSIVPLRNVGELERQNNRFNLQQLGKSQLASKDALLLPEHWTVGHWE